MSIDTVIPWESALWDRYVASHPAATVFHTSAWCRIVSEVGRYTPLCLVSRDGDDVTGVMPVMEIRSRITGNRLGTLPFSDECYALADTADAAAGLLRAARGLRDTRGVERLEMRGAPGLRDGAADAGAVAVEAGFAPASHFNTYAVPLSTDIDAVRGALQRKLRQMIGKSTRLGVTVRRAEGEADLRECYRLYVLNRRNHGIPPQPFELYTRIERTLRGGSDESGETGPRALFYLAEYKGANVASLVALHYNGVTTGKYEGVDPVYRREMPIHPLLWTSIEDAARRGDRAYDLGRTAGDNVGLNEFKLRWGAERIELPYYYYPPGEGISVVRSDSLKYRLFTAAFRRLPPAVTVALGARIFRHFG